MDKSVLIMDRIRKVKARGQYLPTFRDQFLRNQSFFFLAGLKRKFASSLPVYCMKTKVHEQLQQMQTMHPRVCRREFFVSKTINRTRDNHLKELSFLSNLSLFVVNSFPKNSRAFYVNSFTLKNLNKLNTHRKTRLKNTNTTFDFKDLWYNSRPEINLLFRFITVDEHWPVNNY